MKYSSRVDKCPERRHKVVDGLPDKVVITECFNGGLGSGWLTPMALNKHPTIYPSNFPCLIIFSFSESRLGF